MADLKEILGEELYKSVTEKLGDKKIDIVSDGEWIPKDKFNSINEDNKTLKGQIAERDKQLKELSEKATGNDTLKQEIEALKVKNKETVENYEKAIKDKELNYALDIKLKEAKVRNTKAIMALLNTSEIKLDEKGSVLGIEEQLKTLRESDPYLFDITQVKGRGSNGSGSGSAGGKNPFSKEHFNLTEQGKLFKENPELAKKYMEEASSK